MRSIEEIMIETWGESDAKIIKKVAKRYAIEVIEEMINNDRTLLRQYESEKGSYGWILGYNMKTIEELKRQINEQ